ncbi:PRC-barrel domain-containing protein [Calderihabitans maritimus]|uniref:PRC-barrel domain-containing protein n=1 Tax=Calderihabitans maritimus TaxID=1246530 RepID=A0A1Z5HQV8_9FIRM|nr:PRC-barrel domain-containing protein [Calderihabitans maritimus]GAW91660.1 hypothetical protein Dtox_0207 [Calderihabitans maritimus]
MRKYRKQLISLPIISIKEGEQIGKVRDVIVDPKAMAISALLVEQKGRFKEHKLIPFNKIHGIGDHAITVEEKNVIVRAALYPELYKLLKHPTPIGAKVISEKGKVFGVVNEFTCHPDTGQIETLEISGSLISNWLKGKAYLSRNHVLTMGKNAVVVAEEAATHLQKSEGSWQEKVKAFRETGTKVWDTTVQNTKKWGHMLSKSLEKLAAEEEEITNSVYPLTARKNSLPEDEEARTTKEDQPV